MAPEKLISAPLGYVELAVGNGATADGPVRLPVNVIVFVLLAVLGLMTPEMVSTSWSPLLMAFGTVMVMEFPA